MRIAPRPARHPRGDRSRLARSARAGLLAAAVWSTGCSQLVQYTDELTEERTGRSLFVTTPATLGGIVGFVAGIPVDLVALPVTYPVYSYQKSRDPVRADAISTMLFPSFFLWRTGNLIAVPFDLLEFLAIRAWRSPETMTREEREAIELEHDDRILPSYPVETVYPTEEWLQDRAPQPR